MAPSAEALALLEALREQVCAVSEHGQRLLRRVKAGELPTQKGLPPLSLGAHLLLLYLQDLALLIGCKAGGRGLRDCTALPRLLESRVVLEKLRPIGHRLKYQVEKLLRAALIGGRGPNDPLSFRPAPGNMEEEEEEEEEGAGGDKAPGLGGGKRYVPPRLVPVQYEPEGRGPALSRPLRQALTSSAIRELQEELSDGPREEGGGAWPCPAPKAQRDRTRLEESLLTRLRGVGPGHKRAWLQRAGGGALASITHFGDLRPLLDPTNQEAPPSKKKKKPPKGKKKGKAFRRQRRR